MEVLDLRGKKHGALWTAQDIAESGLLVAVHHSKKASTAFNRSNHRITHLVFDARGAQCLVATLRGDIFLFQLDDNYFRHIYSNPAPVTAMGFAPSLNRFLVADADNVLRCIELATGKVIEEFEDYKHTTIHKIHLSRDERLAVITSANHAMLYDVVELRHIRNLHGAEGIGVQEVQFVPESGLLLTTFKDDSLMLWTSDSLEFQARLPKPKSRERLGLKAFALSRSGQYLLAGGKCKCLFFYDLNTEELLKAIELPHASRGAKIVRFLWATADDSPLLLAAVLGHDGCLRILDVNSARILSVLAPPEYPFIDFFSVCPNARYLSVQTTAGELWMYDLVQLLRHTHKYARKAKIKKGSAAANSSPRRRRDQTQGGVSQGLSSKTLRGESYRNHGSLRENADAFTLDGGDSSFSGWYDDDGDGNMQVTSSEATAVHSSASATRQKSLRGRKGKMHTSFSSRNVSVDHRSNQGVQAHAVQSEKYRLERYLKSLPSDALPMTLTTAQKPPLSFSRLREVLLGYGEYPDKYRKFIWARILNLPNNVLAFNALSAQGIHPAYSALQRKYPLKSRKMQRVLQRTLSCLAHWSPVFAEVPYLPATIFPFVRIFANSPMEAFEVCASVLINWCQLWFEFFPNPPISILNMCENVLAEHDVELLQHFVSLGITAQDYAWPILQSMFSEVFIESEWLYLWDNLVSNHPSFIIYVAVAYLTQSRVALLSCCDAEDVEYYLHKVNPIDVRVVVSHAYTLASTTPPEADPSEALEDFTPLTEGTYQAFNAYPEFIVNYQVHEREKIREAEEALLHEKSMLSSVERKLKAITLQDDVWKREQEKLLEAEARRRAIVKEELEMLQKQQHKVAAMKHAQKERHMKVYEKRRNEFLRRQARIHDLQKKRQRDSAAIMQALAKEERTKTQPKEKDLPGHVLQEIAYRDGKKDKGPANSVFSGREAFRQSPVSRTDAQHDFEDDEDFGKERERDANSFPPDSDGSDANDSHLDRYEQEFRERQARSRQPFAGVGSGGITDVTKTNSVRAEVLKHQRQEHKSNRFSS